MVPLLGIAPESIAALIFDLFANTSAWVVKGPPELVEPVAWQLLFIEHTVVRMGCTSVENFGVMPTHENVMPPPVPPPEGVSLLLQAINTADEKRTRTITDIFFIN